jgi:hypothetical protein
MRPLVMAAILLAGACSMNPQYSAPWTVRAVGKAYETRDACLAKYAILHTKSDIDVPRAGLEISANCEAETNALIASSNPHNDMAVTAAIRQDSEFRARGYILKARGRYYDQQEIHLN